MKEGLRYGDPPSPEECRDEGELKVPVTLEMSLDAQVQQRELHLMELIGTQLPPWSQARFAVRHLEKQGNLPAKVNVPKLGTVVVGKEGWGVL